MKKTLVCVMIMLALTACASEKQPILKSPCVGADDSPCGPKRYINNV